MARSFASLSSRISQLSRWYSCEYRCAWLYTRSAARRAYNSGTYTAAMCLLSPSPNSTTSSFVPSIVKTGSGKGSGITSRSGPSGPNFPCSMVNIHGPSVAISSAAFVGETIFVFGNRSAITSMAQIFRDDVLRFYV